MYIIYLHYVSDTVQGCIYNVYKVSFSTGSVQQIMPKLLVNWFEYCFIYDKFVACEEF
jgi:hypothetical protein